MKKPEEASAPNVQRLPDAMASQPDTMNYGAQFANRISVECPVTAASLIDEATAQPLGPAHARHAGDRRRADLSAGCSPSRRNSIAQISGMIRAAKADGSAVWGLLGLSFLYGIFHAAGPGHGKAVISSYLVANEETWRRGVVLSFASALLQAIVAVALVGIAVLVFKATHQNDVRYRARHRDRELRTDRAARRAAVVGQGARILQRVVCAGRPLQRRGRRGDAAAQA